jgi:hypothetical protein
LTKRLNSPNSSGKANNTTAHLGEIEQAVSGFRNLFYECESCSGAWIQALNPSLSEFFA